MFKKPQESGSTLSDKPALGQQTTNSSYFSVCTIDDCKLMWKVDLHVIPILFLIFLCAFTDRISIGNAQIAGIEQSLGMQGNQFNIAVLVFFVPYILLEIPSNLILKSITPSIWFGSIVSLWGITAIGMGFTTNFAGLVTARVFMGIFEAGLMPGSIYLISMYYKQCELQRRITIFFAASVIAGAFGGLLAFAFMQMHGIRGIEGWRWIFIMEGILSVLVAVLAYIFVPNMPEKARFLNAEERVYIYERQVRSTEHIGTMNKLNSFTWTLLLTDWKLYIGTLMYMLINYSGVSATVVMPSIVYGLGAYTPQRTQLMLIPIYIVSVIVSFCGAWYADKREQRYPVSMLGALTLLTGYLILYVGQDTVASGVKYFACFLLVSGCFTAQPLALAWLQNNISGHYKRAIFSAVQIGIGNIGGLIASILFQSTHAPGYASGYITGIAFTVASLAAFTLFYLGIRRAIARRDAGKEVWKFDLPCEKLENLGDSDPRFRYSL
ncbi:hypothetical protein CANCADRAFT_72590 [Tortispora caseinolytica NRRL Y-17796]|uniref:Major facilitator superfamily (MFS) profile domain-containing protein n=1 Tax=Tortispora caseinolytica NRRL Y-17796 TaxID=767744 RepID=A0A1E4TIK6_9ASCO|nr:hypothetical protein CANCADRAFT_72590 [Tortispora caseinolytica NRRL Y-17796]